MSEHEPGTSVGWIAGLVAAAGAVGALVAKVGPWILRILTMRSQERQDRDRRENAAEALIHERFKKMLDEQDERIDEQRRALRGEIDAKHAALRKANEAESMASAMLSDRDAMRDLLDRERAMTKSLRTEIDRLEEMLREGRRVLPPQPGSTPSTKGP